MKIGKAVAIFLQISSKKYTDEEKGQAIMQVVQMPTHNGINKDTMLCVIWYLLNICFELPEDAAPPDAWKKLEKALQEAEAKEAGE